MTPATVRPALRTLIATLTGLDASLVFWSGRPRGFVGPQWIQLRLASIVPRGQDEVSYEYDITRDLGTPSAFDELLPRQTGLRDATLQVQCWSQIDTDTADALSLALAIQDAIHLDANRAALAAVDVAVASVGSPTEITTKEDRRELSVVALDIQLNALSLGEGARIGYVEQWGVKGTATMIDGTTDTIVDEVLP